MHIVIGGAANGKRKYVSELMATGSRWLGDETPLNLVEISQLDADLPAVVCSVEQWMAQHLDDEEQAIQDFVKAISGKSLTIILTDIGRGIVPMDASERALRDACGRLNQHLLEEAKEVTRIWFGIPQKLK
ncbi:bifunctional adenosylcobinamide kinase/adenosylcobinamide-phosphate guanylyltransferase [Sporosarcina aquimarina]|uniref:Bifunctional adenosylcobinamide kinase/adenosylcobinamide-phosphate guanylyltransferase n=1 Tax=Sporosarcina aquimarina TaxID=114975 RepID=A0ABU4FV77_9BACL|nr:bifunctional adenosylcobinamide kinase/adenosylcobinamide-phosphate guanylyltransferase [Sporosarcina aquimarina]MDW0108609.1 bifunctional adenosylcobinamide kinase/adenosylcobinamide-phosphate guanylyltransferase [Sporosarcina aquimarina]